MKITIKREQNNACIGSAEREKFGAKLKTIKHIIWMAALSLTAATWTACSNEDEPVTEQPAQSRTFTVTTTLSPRNGAATRSTMTDNGDGSISAEWEVGDQIWVQYRNNSDNLVETTAEVTAVDPSTKAATIRVTLTDPMNNGEISFGYPYSYHAGTKNPRVDQTGTLDDINDNYAAILGIGQLTVSGSDVTLPAVTMDPMMCIWKFSFTDGSKDITSDITKLIIVFQFIDDDITYTVTPSSLSTIYVAIDGSKINAKPITIYARTATGVYRKAAASVTLDVGLTYTTSGLALSSIAAAKAVAGDVGKVIGADGGIYDNATAATTAGTSAVAMITYVGNDNCESAPYNHGLALALTDANGGNICEWDITEGSKPELHTYTTTNTNDFSSTSESGLQYNDATHNSTYRAFYYARANNSTAAPAGCSAWFLPTGYQWNQMINACKNVLGTNNNYTDLRDGFSRVSGTNMQSRNYWMSTERSGSYAWYYAFNDNDGNWGYTYKTSKKCVRSAIAF